ncbi:putative fungal pheromone GPCR, STE3-type [Mycena rebaudengoi]|nr:putative fungal pheromone GPCR, STE3-type [Mycena rebaudengoi]
MGSFIKEDLRLVFCLLHLPPTRNTLATYLSTMHYELPIGAFVASFLVLVPLPWHWRARNVPTLSIIAWLFLSNIMLGVNAIIWADNIRIVAKVWCDITTKFQVGATMALPMCCLCLCIHLERIASVRQVRTTPEQKRRRMYFDLAMCWGVPAISMALHYIVQGHRFDIVQDFGCRPATYISVAAICLVWVPQLIAVLLTLLFAGAALFHFFQRRLTFARHLQDSSALTPSRYFRLMAMAIVQMVWATFVTGTNMWLSCRDGLRPWISWADVHSNFGRVAAFPRVFIPQEQWAWTYFIFWTVPLTALMFFAFFASGTTRFGKGGSAKDNNAHAFASSSPPPKWSSLPSPGLDSAKHAHDKSEPAFPLTPLSSSSFGAPVPPYDDDTDADVDSLYKGRSASLHTARSSHTAHSTSSHHPQHKSSVNDMA